MKHSLAQVINYERQHGNRNIHQFLAQHPGLVQAFAKQRAQQGGMYDVGQPIGAPQNHVPIGPPGSQVSGPVGSQVSGDVGGALAPPGVVGGSSAVSPPPGSPPPGLLAGVGGPMPPSPMPPGILSGAGGTSLPSQANDVYEMQKKMALLGQGGIGAGFLGGPVNGAGAGPFDPRQLAIQKAMQAFVAKRGAY